MIQDFCDKIYCINMDEHKKRWILVQREFERVGITAERFSGIRHKHKHVGCRLSHQAIIRKARDEGWERVLIFEDDTVFRPGAVSVFDTAVKRLPDEWDLFYFCCIRGSLEYYSEYLFKINSCKMGNAVIYNKSIYDIALKSREQSMDRTNLLIHPRGKSFCVDPMIAEQTHYRLWKK